MRLRGVGKRYHRGSWVLADVDVDLPPGEMIAFTGGNGSGKSTILRILVGVTRPTAGTIHDRPTQIGYVPEQFPPDERMSALSYLTHMGRLRGLSTAESARRAEHLLDRLVLVGGADTPLRTLSKGNAQKVALAQALLISPRLLVLDEPWSGLDNSAHGILAEIMNETTRDGGAVVFTDHRESVIQANSTMIYRIDGGRVALDDGSAPLMRRMETRVVLRAPVNELGIPRTSNWHALEGVLSADPDGEHVTIHVTSAHADHLILTALRDGWSLVEAGQVATPHATAGCAANLTTRRSTR